MNSFKHILLLPWLCQYAAGQDYSNSTQLKASAILYDQTLYTFGTSIGVGGNYSRDYHNYAWAYSLAAPLNTKGEIKTISKVKFPSCITATAFSFSNSSRYPNILAFGQSDKEDLLDQLQLTSTFYSFNTSNNTWLPEPTLSANGPVRRTGASLAAFENSVIIFGGFITSPNYPIRLLTRQVFSYNDTKKSWADLTQAAADANISPSVYHSATIVNGKRMIVLGGAEDNQPSEGKNLEGLSNAANMSNLLKRDLRKAYIFDLESGKWTTQETYSFSSRPRIAHTADYIPSLNSIIVVGGTDKHVNGTIYDDAQLLNLDTWTWKEIMFRGVDGFPERIPRAWHASAVVGDQLFLMHSDPDLATNLVYKVLNIANWTYTNNVQPAPFSRKLKYILQPENTTAKYGSNIPLPSKENEFNGSKFVLVSTVGAMSGAALALLAALAFRKYKNWKREKQKKDDILDPPENFPFHLTPIWANSYSRFDKQLESFIPNITDNALWDLDSQYAYSTHMTFRGNMYQHPVHDPNSSLAADSLEFPIVRPRRWSSDAERTRPKALKEVPPCSTISELFMLTQSTMRQSWASFGKFSHKSYQEVARQAEPELPSNEETMIPSSTSFPEDDAASSYSTLTDTHI